MSIATVKAYQVRLYCGEVLVVQSLYTDDTLYAYTLNTLLEKGVSIGDELYHRIDRMEVNVIQLPISFINGKEGKPITSACTSLMKVN